MPHRHRRRAGDSWSSQCGVGVDRRIDDHRRPLVAQSTALVGGDVARHGRVDQRHRPLVVDARAMAGAVVPDPAALDGRRRAAFDVHATALAAVASAGDDETVDDDVRRVDLDDPVVRSLVAQRDRAGCDREQLRAAAADLEVAGQHVVARGDVDHATLVRDCVAQLGGGRHGGRDGLRDRWGRIGEFGHDERREGESGEANCGHQLVS